MAESSQVLLIDSDATSRQLVRLLVEARWPAAVITEVHDPIGLAKAMRVPSQDLCIVDLTLSWADPSELLEMLCTDDEIGPVVVYTERNQADLAMHAMRSGASHYIIKDAKGPLQLMDALTHWLGPGETSTSRQDEASEAVKRSIAMISHDLQEPIRSIQNYLEVLEEEHLEELSPDAQELLARARAGTKRALQSLRQDIEDVHRTTTDADEPAEIALAPAEFDDEEDTVVIKASALKASELKASEVVRFPEVVANTQQVLKETLEILGPVISREGAKVQHTPLLQVAVQHSHLRRILQNLISNALKFRSSKKPVIKIGCSSDKETVRFTVQDNGIGIGPEHHESIFDMFSRVHRDSGVPGSGIGLAAVRNLVESYGGTISVRSRPGAGSIFEFTLPAAPGASVRVSRKR